MNRLRTGLAALKFAGDPNLPGTQLASLNSMRPAAASLHRSPGAALPAHIPLQGSGCNTACYWPAMILGVINPM